MLSKIGTPSQVLGTVFFIAMTPAQGAPNSCGFMQAFNQPDENGTQTVHVYQGSSSAAIGGVRPFAFVVPDVKVNTDGTRISYNADDPRAQTKRSTISATPITIPVTPSRISRPFGTPTGSRQAMCGKC